MWLLCPITRSCLLSAVGQAIQNQYKIWMVRTIYNNAILGRIKTVVPLTYYAWNHELNSNIKEEDGANDLKVKWKAQSNQIFKQAKPQSWSLDYLIHTIYYIWIHVNQEQVSSKQSEHFIKGRLKNTRWSCGSNNISNIFRDNSVKNVLHFSFHNKACK